MTIVMIGQKGLPARSGGVERHVELLASGLASLGHRVVVFGRSWYAGARGAALEVEQIFTPGIHTKHLDAITHSFTALLAARHLNPDVVHIHGVGIALLAPLARLLLPKAKIVVTFHCIDREHAKWGRVAKAAFRLGEFLACRASHRTIAVSQDLTRYCMETYGAQTTYIPHAFKAESVEHQADAGLATLGLLPNKFFLFVGRLVAHKNPHVLIKAFLRAKGERPDLFHGIKLAIVGGASWTDEYAAWLCRLASSDQDVVLLGEKIGEDLKLLQSNALAHVFPTASEGLSVAVMEACVSKRPVIATSLPSNMEATGGYVLPITIGDEESLVNALVSLLETSPAEREKMSDAACAHVAQEYDYERRIRDVADLYCELCGQAATRQDFILQTN